MKANKQLVKVFNILRDGKGHTLAGIAKRIGAPTQSVSARIRDLRKAKYGGYVITRRPCGTQFSYKLI